MKVTTHFVWMRRNIAIASRTGLSRRAYRQRYADDLKAQAADEATGRPTMGRRLSPSHPDWDEENAVRNNAISRRRVRCASKRRVRSCDPNSWLIAVVIPLLLFIFGYGINLDSRLRVGILLEQQAKRRWISPTP